MQDAVIFDLQLVLQVSVAKAFFINSFAVLADQHLGSRAEAVVPYAEKIIELFVYICVHWSYPFRNISVLKCDGRY